MREVAQGQVPPAWHWVSHPSPSLSSWVGVEAQPNIWDPTLASPPAQSGTAVPALCDSHRSKAPWQPQLCLTWTICSWELQGQGCTAASISCACCLQSWKNLMDAPNWDSILSSSALK